ncbi:hypothetical protein HY439_02445 [Candidatus Microgenomates bacterium]|nr:hypothetical protein [Candidatus Microgenomates bacterium]
MEIPQIVFVIIIGVLTVILVLVALEVIKILKEFKKTVENVNKILTDMGKISEEMTLPTGSGIGTFLGLKTGLKIFKIFVARLKKEKK